jgi:hypothetical protein
MNLVDLAQHPERRKACRVIDGGTRTDRRDVRLRRQGGLMAGRSATSANDPGCVKTAERCYDSLVILQGDRCSVSLERRIVGNGRDLHHIAQSGLFDNALLGGLTSNCRL